MSNFSAPEPLRRFADNIGDPEFRRASLDWAENMDVLYKVNSHLNYSLPVIFDWHEMNC